LVKSITEILGLLADTAPTRWPADKNDAGQPLGLLEVE
jgi:hypothetical protein